MIKIHRLASGATVLVLSPGHGFRFSDGTSCGPQDESLCRALTCMRYVSPHGTIRGHALNEVRMVLDEGQLKILDELCGEADLIMVPFPVLAALREQGVRNRFPNVVSMNATLDTQRASPADKVVDVNNWSY